MSDKPKTPRAQCEIWLMVNEDGDYVASHTDSGLTELYDDCIGVMADRRTIHLSLSVPLPQPVSVSAEIPEDARPGASLALTVEA
jgi:hypothetical protein